MVNSLFDEWRKRIVFMNISPQFIGVKINYCTRNISYLDTSFTMSFVVYDTYTMMLNIVNGLSSMSLFGTTSK